MDRRLLIAAGHTRTGGAKARGHVEGAEAIDIVNRVVDKCHHDERIEVVVVPHILDYREEVGWINERYQTSDAGYCAEVHKNQGGGTGVEAWYLTGDAEDERLARLVLDELAAVSRLVSRGVKPDVDYRGKRLHFLRATIPRAGLFECGFIDVDHFRNDLYAEGLFRGFLTIFGLTVHTSELYRVVRFDGVQVGAYAIRSNAWAAFVREHGNARIVTREGVDVTREFAEEYGEELPRPSPPGAAAPAEDENGDLEHDAPVLTDTGAELLPERVLNDGP